MLCEHCGTDNLDEAIECAQCGVMLGDPHERAEASRMRRKRRYVVSDPRKTAARRGYASVILGAAGAALLVWGLDPNSPMGVSSASAILGLAGAILGFYTVRDLLPISGPTWTRGVALAGTVVSTCVVAYPLATMAWAIAMMPRRIASEPVAINNIRKLSVALQSYVEDNDDRLPGWVIDGSGRPIHNAWDSQIASYVRGDQLFRNGADGRGVRSPTQPPPRSRVVSFGLNGLLITRPKESFDGNADWAAGPAGTPVGSLSNPGQTIVLAELATGESMGGQYAMNSPAPSGPGPRDSSDWQSALGQWIDIDPRAWVETSGPVKSYEKRYWNERKGVGRSLHAGGACYAFADGSVGYRKLRQTVTGGRTGLTPDQYWNPLNAGNMWNPR